MLLLMNEISKYFGHFKALDNACIDINHGEIVGLVGENGAGKSTLIKILNGAYKYDSGTINFNDLNWSANSPQHAQRNGISTIFQEINLSPYLSITENIFLGREIKNKFGFLNWNLMHKETIKIINKFIKEEIDVKKPLESYSTAIKQMIAIARAISFNAKLVVMDEPTSSLDEREVEILFKIMKKLKEDNISLLFVSHNLDDVKKICDRIIIMRDGKTIKSAESADVDKKEIVSFMLGKNIEDLNKLGSTAFSKLEIKNDKTILSAKNLKYGNKVKNVNFEVKKGEIVGLAGLLGSGRTESARLIFGIENPENGKIVFSNGYYDDPKTAIKKGIGFCPEDRKTEGIIPDLSVKDNLTLPLLPKLRKYGVLNEEKQNEIVKKYIKSIGIKCASINQPIRELSGGNQQKVILARWICLNPTLLILDEPTRGIDVGAKNEIQKIIIDFAKKGLSVLMISSELEEIIEGSNTVFILKDGETIAKYNNEEIKESNIIKDMAGA